VSPGKIFCTCATIALSAARTRDAAVRRSTSSTMRSRGSSSSTTYMAVTF